MMVLTAVGKIAYKRKDGVYVVPITCIENGTVSMNSPFIIS